MRKIFLALTVMLLAFTSAFAQVKEGKLIFERKVNMHKMITDPEMRARIPEFRTDKFELLFNSDLAPPLPADEVKVLTAFVNVTTEN